MADELPSEYDVIVIGTGVPESILAAALARIGQGVLHIDRNDYYGSDWATFNFDGLEKWIERNKEAEEKEETKEVDLSNSEVEDGENLVHMPSQGKTISNIEVHSYIKEKNENPEVSEVEPCLAVEPEPCPIIPEDSEQVTMGESSVHFEFEASSEDTDEKHGEQDVAVETTSVNAAEEKSNEHESEQTKSNGQSKDFDSNSACAEQSDKTAPDVTDAESTPEPSAIKCEEVKEANTKTREFTLEDFKRDWRRFNIDIAPKMLFSRGSLVELLISSNISRYAEFKCVTSILTYLNDRIEQVPCSRSDVFSSKFVSMLEKRMLMKFIEFSLSYESHTEQYEEYLDKPFVEFLRTRKLTPNLQHFVQHSIAMVTDQTPTVEGLKATHHFLRSLGRYGNTPFLWPLYGSGELPQCFCRMCAVFAGIYVLRRSGQALIVDEESKLCKGIIDSQGQRLNCRWVIMEGSYVPHQHRNTAVNQFVSRGVFFTDRSLKHCQDDQVMLLTIPPIQGKNPVRVIELNHCAYACPKGMYVVQMTCKGSGVAKDDLQFVVDMLFHQNSEEPTCEAESEQRPKVLWCMYFNQLDTSECLQEAFTGLPENVLVTSGPGHTIGFEHAVIQAQKLFEKICPGEEFLPAAPNPEDIIYMEDEGEKKQVGFEKPPSEDVETPESEAGKPVVEGSKVEGDSEKVTEEGSENDNITVDESKTVDEDQDKAVALVEDVTNEIENVEVNSKDERSTEDDDTNNDET